MVQSERSPFSDCSIARLVLVGDLPSLLMLSKLRRSVARLVSCSLATT